MMKSPFSRKRDVSSVPAEIQEYYQSERRERTGIAWLLALGTLLITIGLAALLFFGGRWAYRTIVDNDDDNQNQETAQTEKGQEVAEAPENSSTEQGTSSTGTSSTSTSTPNGSTSTQGTAGSSTTSQPSGSAPQIRTTTPATGDDLPDTGAGDVVALFAATAIIAGAAHYAVSTRRDS